MYKKLIKENSSKYLFDLQCIQDSSISMKNVPLSVVEKHLNNESLGLRGVEVSESLNVSNENSTPKKKQRYPHAAYNHSIDAQHVCSPPHTPSVVSPGKLSSSNNISYLLNKRNPEDEADTVQENYTDFECLEDTGTGDFISVGSGQISAAFLHRNHTIYDGDIIDEEVIQPNNDEVVNQNFLDTLKWKESFLGSVKDDVKLLSGIHHSVTFTCIENGTTPFKTFLLLFPEFLWKKIALCTNKKRLEFVRDIKNGSKRKDLKYFLEEIKTSRIFVFISLLILNMLHGHKEGLSAQWINEGSELRPGGRFSKWMSRDEFRVISRYLCFHDLDDPIDVTDKHFRLRSIIETLNKTFRTCYKLGIHYTYIYITLFYCNYSIFRKIFEFR